MSLTQKLAAAAVVALGLSATAPLAQAQGNSLPVRPGTGANDSTGGCKGAACGGTGGTTTNITNNPTANGGQGGTGGQGGAGGQGGNVTSVNTNNPVAQGGQGGNGSATSTANANANANGNQIVTFQRTLPMGFGGGVSPPSGGICTSGWAFSLSAPFVGAGGGQTEQDQFCLGVQAATAMMNAGYLNNDRATAAYGIAALTSLFPEWMAGAQRVMRNAMKPCGEAAGKRSAMFLAFGDLDCSQFPVEAVKPAVPAKHPPKPRRPAAVVTPACSAVTVTVSCQGCSTSGTQQCPAPTPGR